MNDAELLKIEQAAIEMSRRAGEILLEHFNKPLTITYKSPGQRSPVTNADEASDVFLRAEILRRFPTHTVLSEEDPTTQEPSRSEITWVIDPLDGTRNYAAGLPTYAVTLALTKGDNVLVGATYDPSRQEMFSAERGLGATCNELGVKASTVRRAKDSLIGLDLGYHDEKGGYAIDLLESVWPGVQGFRIMGSAALGLAYVAAGRFDGFWEIGLKQWDMAAGVLLVQEAGGIVSDFTNGHAYLSSGNLIAANAKLHPIIADSIRPLLTETLV